MSFVRRSVSLLAAATFITSSGLAPASANHDDGRGKESIVFTVDVAEDFTLFVPTKVRPTDTQPERGAFFVTEGNIYPAGTIKGTGEHFDPRREGALGRWFCRGTHLVSGAEFPNTAHAVHTAQIYLLPSDKASISTEGVEGRRIPECGALRSARGVIERVAPE